MNGPTLCFLTAACLLATANLADAQTQAPGAVPGYPPPTAPAEQSFHRSGFLIGFSIGAGSYTLYGCGDCDSLGGPAFDIHLGGMLTPRFALMLDASGVSHYLKSGATAIHVIDTVAAQYWLTPQVWIKGGVGPGQLSINDTDGGRIIQSEIGAGVLIAAGFEIVQTRTFALDLQARASVVNYDRAESVSMASMSLGFNWY